MSAVIVRGTGSIGRRHLRVLRAMGVQAYAFPVREGGDEEVEGAAVVRSWSRAENARYAVIATDTGRHLRDANEALDAGLALLIEKPLASHAEGVASLLERARSKGLSVFVGCNMRFSTGLQRARRWLLKVGKIYSARIECQSHLPSWRPGKDHRAGYAARRDEGGVLRDLVHEVDYALWLFGAPKAVYAQLKNSGELQIESEESADLLWHAPGGAAVSLRLDYLARRTRRSTTIVGSEGELVWDAVAQTVSFVSASGERESESVTQERDGMYIEQMRAFLSGNTGDLATGDEGLLALAVLDAARASSERNALVEISSG